MLKVLLIWVVTFLGTPNQSLFSQSLNCYEYTLTVNSEGLFRTDEICYSSSLQKESHKYILTVTTDSIVVRFAILRSDYVSDEYGFRGTQSYAIIAGQPNQLYVITERTREQKTLSQYKKEYYFFARPINLHGSRKPIHGRVLVASNKEICKL